MKTTQFNFSKLISTAKYVGVATLFVAGLATFSGCATTGCTDETADNYDADATEDDGSCIPARDKFLGTYSVVNSCLGSTAYTCIISTSSAGDDKVVISNMGSSAWTATGTIVENSITLSGTATDVDCGTITISGSGTLSGTVVTLSNVTYTVSNTTNCNNIGPCTETFTKQ